MQLLVDLKNGFLAAQSHAPISLAATTNGTGVDCITAANVRTHVIIETGVVTGSAIFDYTVEESDDNSTYGPAKDLANADSGHVAAAGVTILSFLRSKRYVRVVATLVSGTSAIVSALVLAQLSPAGASSTGFSISPQS